LLTSRGDREGAEKALQKAVTIQRAAIRLKPDDTAAHLNLGAVLCDGAHDYTAAITEFRQVIRLQPDIAMAHHNLGVALRHQGKLDEVIAAFRAAIQLQPDFAGPHHSLGCILGDQKHEHAAAAAEFREVIRLQPENASAHANLGFALAQQGKMAEAITECREAIRLKPDDAQAYLNLHAVLQNLGKLDEAIAAYRAAIRLKPDYGEFHNGLAWALVLSPKRLQREYDEGLVHARKAVEQAPQHGGFANTLALAEYRLGHWAESIAAAKRSIELLKDVDASNWFFLAMAHGQKGNKDEARKWFDKAVAWTKEKAPKNDEFRQFWREAAELLGQQGPDTAGTGSPSAPTVEKPH
jgi:tetratricopeptide (TPR) repeat protein